jgi:hypothetical protein
LSSCHSLDPAKMQAVEFNINCFACLYLMFNFCLQMQKRQHDRNVRRHFGIHVPRGMCPFSGACCSNWVQKQNWLSTWLPVAPTPYYSCEYLTLCTIKSTKVNELHFLISSFISKNLDVLYSIYLHAYLKLYKDTSQVFIIWYL